ncbi:MAG: TolC family protein [Bacteroidota bacterium]
MKFLSVKHMWKGYKLVLVLITWVIPARSFGQDIPDLSLSDAIRIGLENNFDIRVADQNIRVAENNNHIGNAGMLPRIDFSMGGTWFETQSPASFLVNRVNGTSGISLNWTIFDGYRAIATKDRLEFLEEQSVGNAAIIVETTLQAIILAYYNSLIAAEQVSVLEETLGASRRRFQYEEVRKEIGASGTFELLQFKDALFTDSTNLAIQGLNYRNALKNLNLLINVPIETQWNLTGRLQDNFPSYDLIELRQEMLANNANLQNQYITNHILRQDTRLARANMYPTIGINGNTNYGLGTVTRIDGNSSDFSAFDYSAGLTLSLNLFNGGQTRRAIRSAEINEQIGKLQERQLEEALQNDLWVAHDTYNTRREIKDLTEELASNAQTNLEIAEDRFESGLINSLDYRQIQLQLLQAQLSRLQAIRDLIESETELIRLTGGLVREEG